MKKGFPIEAMIDEASYGCLPFETPAPIDLCTTPRFRALAPQGERFLDHVDHLANGG